MKLFTIFKKNEVPTSRGYTIVTQEYGDLDGDGGKECITIFNTTEGDVFGLKRELQIHKLEKGKWKLWKKSNHILPPSEHSGVKDYKVELEIQDGTIKIKNTLNSAWKLEFSDYYQYQDGDFKFIRYESLYGKNGEYWIKINLDAASDLSLSDRMRGKETVMLHLSYLFNSSPICGSSPNFLPDNFTYSTKLPRI